MFECVIFSLCFDPFEPTEILITQRGYKKKVSTCKLISMKGEAAAAHESEKQHFPVMSYKRTYQKVGKTFTVNFNSPGRNKEACMYLLLD